jgi:alcohol dehydrogenase class IV
MVSWELTAPRVLFGAGKLAEAPAEIAALGVKKALLVTGRSGERAARLAAALGARGIDASNTFHIDGEPSVERVREGVALALEQGADGVVAIGGGSALDAGKAIAAIAANGGDPLDYLEVIGKGRPITRASLPWVAIPTTAGTGSEVTRNAVLGSAEARVKASLRSPLMLARLALVDPDLLAGAPAAVLAASGMDALSQCIEPFLSLRANPLTDGLAREGMRRSARSLARAVASPDDAGGPEARADLAFASVAGGLCLAHAGLGAVHGFAAPVGGMWDAPHGAVCAALLAPVMDVNLRALRARHAGAPVIERFTEVAVLLTGRADARAEDGLAWIERLRRELRVPGLAAYGMSVADVPALVGKARLASSMRANPLTLSDDELGEIATRALAGAP